MQLKYIYRETDSKKRCARGRPMSRLLPALLGTLLCSATASEAADPRNVGEAVVIKNQVTAAEAQKDKRRLAKGDGVREQELLEAQTVSHGEFRLADDTKLALGPGARLVLDKFVYDPDRTGKQVLINFAAGSFRFISSSKDPTGYELKTPTATLGIRGTVFDFYVAEKGRMVVLMHKGAVDVCHRQCHPPRQPDGARDQGPCARQASRECGDSGPRCCLQYGWHDHLRGFERCERRPIVRRGPERWGRRPTVRPGPRPRCRGARRSRQRQRQLA
jgi:hypothetical protein